MKYGEDIAKHANIHSSTYKNIAATIQSTIVSIAVIVGGLWTYYKLIKGRTFSPKLNITISMPEVNNKHKEVHLIHLLINNNGSVRINPRETKLDISSGELVKNEIVFQEILTKDNIFSSYYPNGERFYIEPKDEVVVDIPFVLDIKKQCVIFGINIKIYDYNGRVWTENVMFHNGATSERS